MENNEVEVVISALKDSIFRDKIMKDKEKIKQYNIKSVRAREAYRKGKITFS